MAVASESEQEEVLGKEQGKEDKSDVIKLLESRDLNDVKSERQMDGLAKIPRRNMSMHM